MSDTPDLTAVRTDLAEWAEWISLHDGPRDRSVMVAPVFRKAVEHISTAVAAYDALSATVAQEHEHVHDYLDAGLRHFTDYRDGTLPGGGAYPVRYARVFRCRSCLAIHVERVDIVRNSYDKTVAGSAPATEAEESAMRGRRG